MEILFLALGSEDSILKIDEWRLGETGLAGKDRDTAGVEQDKSR